jgi:hypothetical protein
MPTIAGNIIRRIVGSPVLIAGSNQQLIEAQIEQAGDLIAESLGFFTGGTGEAGASERLQTIVAMQQYKTFGQSIKDISPEGNVTVFEYFP